MMANDFRAALASLGFDRYGGQKRLSEILGVSQRTIKSWIDGDRSVPEPVSRILRLACAGKFDLALLKDA